MAVIVRAVLPGDRERWGDLRSALWPEEDGESLRAEAHRFSGGTAARPEAALVAVADGRVIGFAEVAIRNYAEGCSTDRIGYLEGWFVEPDWRRRGIGRLLVDGSLDWARGQGCTEFGSDALAENETSIAAHQALGFEVTCRLVTFLRPL